MASRILSCALAAVLLCPLQAIAWAEEAGDGQAVDQTPAEEQAGVMLPVPDDVGAGDEGDGEGDGVPPSGGVEAEEETSDGGGEVEDGSFGGAPAKEGEDASLTLDEDAEDAEEEEGAIASQSIDLSDPESAAILASHVVPGLDPPNTTVNLFDYDTGRRAGEAIDGVANVPGDNSPTRGTDTLGFTGSRSAEDNYRVWLDDPDGINYGRLLTFGDGMRHLGYWNQGLVKNYGAFADRNPGMQNIVAPTLMDGFPCLSDALNPDEWPAWLRTGDYDAHTQLYADARRDNGALIYDAAGDKNVSNGVQYLSQNPGQASSAPANTPSGGGLDLSESARSLSYLFDPDVVLSSTAKVSHSDVSGLFQIDAQGYYYYNMRENYAWYDGSTNSFVLYDEPAGLRTDAPAGSTDPKLTTGNFFPFNSPADAFSIGDDGQLVNAMNANNDVSANSAPVDHHLGLTMETDFRQPVDGMVGSNPMTFEFIGDDDLWVFVDDVLVLDLGGIHSELFGTIDFSTGSIRLGTAFNTGGEVDLANTCIETTILEMFEVAGVDTSKGFTGDTFASNTSHTLKMFYLERGNYDSSLKMRFNLQPELYQQFKKVDQDGEPVSGAEFDLYAVQMVGSGVASAEDATLDDVSYGADTLLTSAVTDSEGMARFMDGANPFNFADRVTDDVGSQLYVLKERSAPAGYRMMPTPLLLRYDRQTGTFIVNNRYETGAYASFNSYVNQISNENLSFGAYDPSTGHIASTSYHVPLAQQRDGLVVAIPTIRQHPDVTSTWDPLFGSNNGGLQTVAYDVASEGNDAMRNAMLQAALYQAYLSSKDGSIPGWYLSWNDAEKRLRSYYTEPSAQGERLVCTLSELPGTPSRYVLNDPDGDMQMVYGVVSGDFFGPGASTMTAADKYAHLAAQVEGELAGVSDPSPEQLKSAVEAVARIIDGQTPTSGAAGAHATRGFNAIDTSDRTQFERNFRTVLNIPNEQRELRVWKVDQNDERVNGAVFALFESRADAVAAADATVSEGKVTGVMGADGSALPTVAAGVTGDLTGAQNRYQGDDLEGMLIFAPYVEDGAGAAHTTWSQGDDSNNGKVLYLKEVKAPTGFEPNDTVITVVIGQYGIYADAGNDFDGVDVLAGVGKLATTMSKYAASPQVNLTLRYITATWQSQPSSSVPLGASSIPFDAFNAGWSSDASKQMDLVYGENAIIDYGSPDPFTEEQIAQGIGYVDAEGRDRPLFRTSSGFLRTQVGQDTAAMKEAQAGGAYAGIGGDDLTGQDLTNLFMIRNTVRVTDTRHAAPQVEKVDEEGKPLSGAEFQLYAAEAPAGVDEDGLPAVTLADLTGLIDAAPIARFVTDATGRAEFEEVDAAGEPTGKLVDFSVRAQDKGLAGGRLYVLRETVAPAGHRALLSDVLMRFEPETSMLIVNNRYETGASGSFASFVNVDADIHYATYASGSVSPGTETVSEEAQREGLIVAVPLMCQDGTWRPLWGSAIKGYETCTGSDEASIFEAALRQAAFGEEPWHLDWNDALGALVGYLEGLPGTADRYRLKNPDGDMQMVYACVSPEALVAAGVPGASSSARRYEALGQKCKEDAAAVLARMSAVPDGLRIIDAADLDRNFQALVYIPNESRQLKVWKVDDQGKRLDGAVFALFEDRTDAERAVSAEVSDGVVVRLEDEAGSAVPSYAAGVTGPSAPDGLEGGLPGALVFAPNVEDAAGSAHTMWIDDEGEDLTGRILYLKEVRAPDHYLPNEAVVPIVIGRYGIYADAGSADDGVDVLAGAGALAAPLRKFAASPDVNLTLRYLLSSAQAQPSLSFDGTDARVQGAQVDFSIFDDAWDPSRYEGEGAAQKQMQLIYGQENALVDYGTDSPFTEEELAAGVGYVDARGIQRPLFTTTTGFLRTRLEQDSLALREAQASGAYAGVRADDLEGEDLTQLFMLQNTVRVTDLPDPDDPPPPEEPEPEEPEEPGPEGPGLDPGDPPEEDLEGPSSPVLRTLRPIPFPETGDRLGGAVIALAVLIALASTALIADRKLMRASHRSAPVLGGALPSARYRKRKKPDGPHFRT